MGFTKVPFWEVSGWVFPILLILFSLPYFILSHTVLPWGFAFSFRYFYYSFKIILKLYAIKLYYIINRVLHKVLLPCIHSEILCMLASLVKKNIYMLLQLSNSKLDMNPLSKKFKKIPIALTFHRTQISLLAEQKSLISAKDRTWEPWKNIEGSRIESRADNNNS